MDSSRPAPSQKEPAQSYARPYHAHKTAAATARAPSPAQRHGSSSSRGQASSFQQVLDGNQYEPKSPQTQFSRGLSLQPQLPTQVAHRETIENPYEPAYPDQVRTATIPPVPPIDPDEEAIKGMFGEDGFSIGDILDIVNPLHHIPIISHFYREWTGDEIGDFPRMAGGALFGGPLGFASSFANIIIEDTSGDDIAGHIQTALFGSDDESPAQALPDNLAALPENAAQQGQAFPIKRASLAQNINNYSRVSATTSHLPRPTQQTDMDVAYLGAASSGYPPSAPPAQSQIAAKDPQADRYGVSGSSSAYTSTLATEQPLPNAQDSRTAPVQVAEIIRNKTFPAERPRSTPRFSLAPGQNLKDRPRRSQTPVAAPPAAIQGGDIQNHPATKVRDRFRLSPEQRDAYRPKGLEEGKARSPYEPKDPLAVQSLPKSKGHPKSRQSIDEAFIEQMLIPQQPAAPIPTAPAQAAQPQRPPSRNGVFGPAPTETTDPRMHHHHSQQRGPKRPTNDIGYNRNALENSAPKDFRLQTPASQAVPQAATPQPSEQSRPPAPASSPSRQQDALQQPAVTPTNFLETMEQNWKKYQGNKN